MLDAPIMTGANIFITTAIVIIAAVAAVMALDVYKNTVVKKKPSDKK
jgi:hypothetical protein